MKRSQLFLPTVRDNSFIDSWARWNYEGYERTIDAHVKNLRQKLEPDPHRPRYVLTVHGVGYRLADADRRGSG
ncbi:MAG: helix-turn-helix domain-containing protein [Candidatus Rokubacteria bacterium]|nr:helix-turn-helix domain-containing protein [Candidatus Rokubacteria bacterium]